MRTEPDLAGRQVLLVAVGTRGDVEPFTRLGQALARAGASVSAAVLADGADRVRRAGLRPVVVGPPAARTMWWGSALARTAAELSPGLMYLQMRGRLAAHATALAGALAAAAAEADVVLTGLACARIVPVLDRAGVPARLVLHAPLLPHPTGTAGWDGPVWRLLPRPLEEVRQDLMWRLTTGLSRALAEQVALRTGVGRAAGRRRADTAYAPLLATSRALDPSPSPRTLQTGWWPDPAPVRPLPAEAERWLARHPGAVLLTEGSLPVASPEQQVCRLMDVARRVARPAVLQTTGVPPGPRDRALVLDEADHRALLPRVEAIVHHGGSGITHAAATAGIPQVVLPRLGDQPHYARQVHRTGQGPPPLPPARATRRAVAVRLARALEDPAYREAATRAAATVAAEDGLSVAVTEVARMCR